LVTPLTENLKSVLAARPLVKVKDAYTVLAVALFKLHVTPDTEVPTEHDGEEGPVTSAGNAKTRTSPV
jgi:hypothetical protein